MADIYVRSGAAGLNDGTSWTDAYVAFASAVTAATSADRILVAHDHNESLGATTTYIFPTTAGLQVLCVSTVSGVLATSAVINATGGAFSVALTGHAYVYGITFSTTGTGTRSTVLGSGTISALVFEKCVFSAPTSGTRSLNLGGDGSGNIVTARIELLDCTVSDWAGAGGKPLNIGKASVYIRNLTIGANLTTSSIFRFATNSTHASALVENTDFSPIAFSAILTYTTRAVGTLTLRNCKLPANIAMVTGTPDGPSAEVVKLHNCDSADTNYRFREQRYEGSVEQETVIVRTGGASDGDTPISFEMVSSANTKFFHPLETPEMGRRQNSIGSAITVTVEVVTDGVTLTDADAWLEVQYLGTSGFPQGSMVSDRAADVLATPANQTTSSETWTTTGLAAPVKQKLAVTFTPQEKGMILAKVMLARPSTTMYVDPVLTVS